MDPNTTLREMIELAQQDWTGKDTGELAPDEIDKLHTAHIELCELVLGLHGWLAKGGFLPERWKCDDAKTP